MVYLPTKIVTVSKGHLTDHVDLTETLSSFTKQESYLVVMNGKSYTALNLSQILVFEKVDLTKSISNGLTNLLTDQFVSKYKVSYLPGINPFISPGGLRVFDPSATKKHQVHFSSVHTPEIIDDPRQKGFLDDLVIVSTENMKNYLVAVNGVFHPTTYVDGKLWVLDGFRTIRLSGKRDIVIVDTSLLGGHTIVPLTTSNVEKTGWGSRALISLAIPLANTRVFPVIDGYFHHRDTGVMEWQSLSKAYLHTNKLSLIEQFRHNPRTFLPGGRWERDENPQSRRYTDPFQSVFGDSYSVPTATLQSSEFQYSRLTSFHSFLVCMNNPYIYTVDEELEPNGNPQFFTHQGETYLSGMMRYGCGLSPSYAVWSDPEGRQSVFIPEQVVDGDTQTRSANPACIPVPGEIVTQRTASMINYISA